MRRITGVGITIVASMGFLLWLATSEAYAQTPRPLRGLQVVDADGQLVGDVLGIHFPHIQEQGGAIVAFNADGISFPLLVLRNRFSGGIFADALLFESNNCSGPPFMRSNTQLPFLTVAVNEPGNTVYRPGDTSQSVDVESSRGRPGGPCQTFSITFPNLFPAFELFNLLDTFTPPFSVQSADDDDD